MKETKSKYLQNLITKEIILFTKSKMRFEATLTGTDGYFIKIIDHTDKKEKTILIGEISTIIENERTNYTQNSTRQTKTTNVFRR